MGEPVLTAYTIIVREEDRDYNEKVINHYKDYLDKCAEYSLGKDYSVWQIDTLMPRPNAEVYQYLLSVLKSLAMHQEGSTYIIVKDKASFVKFLKDCYSSETKNEFIYDMLTIGERYEGLRLQKAINMFNDDHLVHFEGSTIYSLALDPGCVYLFSAGAEVVIEDGETGEHKPRNILKGYEEAKFYIGVFGKKS